ncbi:uncharacterized protein LOC109827150 isoform X1 [Asparagus officinalis]|uniref:uncharacterized protein LOC109827150 isoform X1 n=1 Tax=Asparagus officinalis TaxID=4686 RepID=UPI00098E7380|nr:uncharacterized protein LOC109827150 isoform X1 [Asparagus officinalis]XP_020249702.1 uncharacterized protein LOC109827150 isoform X1 [Asparagus officinalis]XP_020249703.1 uncharacterized protein LOC109827150 isoform X1 [Asparagus officinalis]XP_020249704.1 uncharacterized protein LOC109827150 isoform X1 [Asparagus officinalis]XP_020249705.1 uncharacterized protein LOC109827150 isoform X1 [Asparagus officinalis]
MLVIVGGVTSNTDATQLAEIFAENKCSTKVIGVPVTFYGDLKNQFVEADVGFDTICKVTLLGQVPAFSSKGCPINGTKGSNFTKTRKYIILPPSLPLSHAHIRPQVYIIAGTNCSRSQRTCGAVQEIILLA